MTAAGPATLDAALQATADGAAPGAGYTFHLDDAEVALSYPELAERAARGARRLAAMGVEPGDPVGLFGPNRPEWVVWAFAIWSAGAVLVPVQIPLRIRRPDAFAEQVRALVEAAGCRRVIADPRLLGVLPDGVGVDWEERGDESSDAGPPPGPGSAAVIQFTSGSTSAPKGALITHAAALAQMEVLRHGYRYEDGTPRSVLSWTPFFHDLGLFANVVHPAVSGSTTHHLPTERFARDPVEWLRLVGRTRPAGTIAPSSAFGSALRLAKRRGEQIDLSPLEAAFFAAEGVDPDVVARMLDDARGFGFDPSALGSSYGLAEAVMAVSYPLVGTGLRLDRIGIDALARDGIAAPVEGTRSRLVVSCGKPFMEVRIAGPDGARAEREVGEILIRGASMMSGYVGAGAADDPFDDGWLRTGDLGYLADGELFPIGRAKDMVIAMGHNYYAEDFEWAAGRVDGVRPGRSVAFADPGSEQVVLLVEPAGDGDRELLRRDVRRAVADAVGVAPGRVVVLAPGTVEKTTSGKLRRAAMREAYARGALAGD
jgi:fatty-acyl-CoA synthase